MPDAPMRPVHVCEPRVEWEEREAPDLWQTGFLPEHPPRLSDTAEAVPFCLRNDYLNAGVIRLDVATRPAAK